MSANMHKTFGGGIETNTKLTGLLGGAQVLTMRGYMPIAGLEVGDRIITRNGMRTLQELRVERHMMRPIRVGQGTLGFSRPNADMLMAPDQEVMVRDWRAEMLFGRDMVIVNISTMVDGKYIAEEEELALHDVYQLRFDGEEIFYADGVEVISDFTAETAEGSHKVREAA
ncbi:Hint domain-containing protein [Litoreibacter janthinus]|uniref:Hint domain-containing protein n=1 Tax=Litoreibacter janthinus TaxID=670154 RepID=A0A1I6HBJ2_9RHOB|nr:Hint domain-containing protein [Litoreibacter janthinus]SFR51731.1 Hint domain-containing protein [Litoreibacter janthinus]